ncbi:MAG TPA: ferredoxin [Anaerolineaceae bacterium]|nr:ferredoxin [Anaerolineaceae bacterium]
MIISSYKELKMKVRIDRDLCTGCGLCSAGLPEVFEMGDDNIATVLVNVVPAAFEKATKDAAADCPCEAIIIE